MRKTRHPAYAPTLGVGISRRAWLAGVALLSVPPARSMAADIVVIVHPDNAQLVEQVFVQRLYTGLLRAWPDGSPAFPLDLPEDHATRTAFSQQWLARSVTNVRTLWAQNVFTGKGLPPRITSMEHEMKRLVATNRNAIGYLAASQADSSVRVVRL